MIWILGLAWGLMMIPSYKLYKGDMAQCFRKPGWTQGDRVKALVSSFLSAPVTCVIGLLWYLTRSKWWGKQVKW